MMTSIKECELFRTSVLMVGATAPLSNTSAQLRALASLDDLRRQGPDRPRAVRKPRQPAAHRLTAAEQEQVVKAYQTGMSKNAVARHFNFHRHTIDDCLARAGVTPRLPGLSPSQVNDVAALYQQGWSMARLSAEYSCSDTAIATALKRAGVPPRPRGRNPVDRRSSSKSSRYESSRPDYPWFQQQP